MIPTRYRTILIGAILLFGYWPAARYLPTNPQFEAEHALRVALGSVGVMLYLTGIWRALFMPRPSFAGQLTLGIGMSLVGSVGASMWLILWRLSERPDWMLQANISGWWLWWQILGIALHVTAKRALVNGVERINWRWIAAAVLLGVVLTIVVVGVRPDMRAFTDWIRPAFDDGF